MDSVLRKYRTLKHGRYSGYVVKYSNNITNYDLNRMKLLEYEKVTIYWTRNRVVDCYINPQNKTIYCPMSGEIVKRLYYFLDYLDRGGFNYRYREIEEDDETVRHKIEYRQKIYVPIVEVVDEYYNRTWLV